MSGQLGKFPVHSQDQALSSLAEGYWRGRGFMLAGRYIIIQFMFISMILGCLVGCGQDSSEKMQSAVSPKGDTLAKLASLRALNVEGKQVLPFGILSKGIAKGAALLFVATDCPISNRYAPEVNRIYKRFENEAIPFYLVYTRPDESFDDIKKHLSDYEYRMTALVDQERQLTEYTGAQVTPEAVVFDARGEMIYRGRIDDRFEDFGLSRQESTTHELEDVMALIADGKTQGFHEEIAVGCYIVELFEESGDE